MPIVHARINKIDRMLKVEQYPDEFDVSFLTTAKRAGEFIAFMPTKKLFGSSVATEQVDTVGRFKLDNSSFVARYVIRQELEGVHIGTRKYSSTVVNTIGYSHLIGNERLFDQSLIEFGYTDGDGSFREVETGMNSSDLSFLVTDIFDRIIPAKLDELKQAGKIGSVPDDRVLLK